MPGLDQVLKAVAEGPAAAASVCEQLLSDDAMADEGMRWRVKGLQRCFRALQHAQAVGDRAALWREAVRLADGRLPINPDETLAPDVLRRFGLGWGGTLSEPALLLHPAHDTDALGEAVEAALRLDVTLRQPYTSAVADALLLRHSPYQSYRTPTQKAAVRAMTSMPPGASLLVTMPTGAGKSLLFEIAPPWWQAALEGAARACAIVIVPTIALALAHAKAFANKPGLEGSAALVSDLDLQERSRLLNAFRRGEVPLLFLSPEMAMNPTVSQHLREAAQSLAAKGEGVGLNAQLLGVFIDEAHIIESWGRSFRPDFQRLPGFVKLLRQDNPELRVVLLSATVGAVARKEIIRAYRAEGAFLEVDARVPRYELDLVTQMYASAEQRKQRVLELVDRLPRPALIYTTLVEDANDLRDALLARGYQRVAAFTGALKSNVERKRIVDDWSEDRLDLVVATSAFGMGIDKADVRAVLHACVPESPARYYQEIGRVARDGHQGLAVMLRVEHQGRDDDWGVAFSQAVSGWLGAEKIAVRWKAMLDDAMRRGATKLDNDGRPRLKVALTAAHAGLERHTGEQNELWNMSLLNLLQRAELLRVDVVDESQDSPAWDITLTAPWLFEAPSAEDARWASVVALRNAEQRAAKDDLRHFQALLDEREVDCLLAGLFRLVETDVALAEPCGRCPYCRAHDLEPPQEVKFQGLDQAWSAPCRPRPTAFSTTVSIVRPEDSHFESGLPLLLQRLAAAGIEQIVLPAECSPRAAQLLQEAPCRFGYIVTLEDFESATCALANVPTAVLVPAEHPQPRLLLARLRRHRDRAPGQKFVLVVAPEVSVEGRPLAQVASASAPLREQALERLSQFMA